MRRTLLVALSIAAVTTAWSSPLFTRTAAGQEQAQAQGRRAEPRRAPDPQPGPPPDERAKPNPPEQQARPRPPSETPQRPGRPNRPSPPPRVVPPRFYAPPHVYSFPPVSLQRGYYYHPYFGFYFGPYYGPFYPFPGLIVGPFRYGDAAIRTKVKPVETQVYVNGYYAGIVDDFDGVFQRLSLPAGEQQITLVLRGYQTFGRALYLNPGDTQEITHQMVLLRPGTRAAPPPGPRALPEDWTSAALPRGDRPASPFGILDIKVTPADAQLLIDGEAWIDTGAQPEQVVHVAAGWHQVEVRKDGYQSFKTELELTEGVTTRLNVALSR